MFPWFGVLEFTVQKKNPPWRLQSDHRRGVAGVLAESVGIDPKTRKGSSRLAIGAGNPTGSLSNIWRGLLVSFQLRNAPKARMQPLHLAHTINENLKLGNPGWYRSNDSAVRARRFSISLRGITLWWESLGSNQVLGVFSAPQ